MSFQNLFLQCSLVMLPSLTRCVVTGTCRRWATQTPSWMSSPRGYAPCSTWLETGQDGRGTDPGRRPWSTAPIQSPEDRGLQGEDAHLVMDNLFQNPVSLV